MVDTLDKLGSVYGAEREAGRIQAKITYLAEHPNQMTAEDIFNLMEPTTQDFFLSNKKNVRIDQKRRILRQMDQLMRDGIFTENDLIKLPRECIKKNGKIDEDKFKKFLNGEEEI